MPVKIRLSRHGKKAYPFYHIVVADSRAPRDGRYIERLGIYNPNTNPATIEFDFDRALDWLQKGAQPTDTARSILSKRGVLIKKHLLEGVKKGAFSAEVAEQKFESWLKEKDAKIQAEKDQISKEKESERKKRLEAESKVKEAKIQELTKKLAAESASEEPVAETSAEEPVEPAAKGKVKAKTEEPAQAEVVAESSTEPAAEKTEEVPAEPVAKEKAKAKTSESIESGAQESPETNVTSEETETPVSE